MGKKLYVGNLSFDATEDEVRSAFSACGDIAGITIVTDRMTGRSRGFAFVEMGSDDSAQRAIEELNGHSLRDRPLRVSEAVDKPRTGRTDGARGGGGGYGGGGPGGDRGYGGSGMDRGGGGERRGGRGERPGGGGRRERSR